jgi:cysteine synthase
MKMYDGSNWSLPLCTDIEILHLFSVHDIPTSLQILAKAEFMNPGGSVKDRVAAAIIREGLASGQLRPGGLITEGTAGSTGVSLAMLAPAVGCTCFIAMPDDAAQEKASMLKVGDLINTPPPAPTPTLPHPSPSRERGSERTSRGEII